MRGPAARERYRSGRSDVIRRAQRLLLVAIVVVIAGCGRSPRTQFFILAPVRPDHPAARFAAAPVQVRAVHVPPLLDRLQRVTEGSGARIQVHEFEQWGAPLDEMTRRVLSEDLAARLPAGMVLDPRAPSTAATRGIVVDIEEFVPQADGTVVLRAAWTLLPGSGAGAGQGTQPLAHGQQRLTMSAGGGADAQVAAMNALLARLADELAAAVMRSASQ